MPKIPASVRRLIFEKLMTSPERKKMLEEAIPTVEEALKFPGVRRGYIGGSMASKKIKPGDIDVFLRVSEPEFSIESIAKEYPLTSKSYARNIHLLPYRGKGVGPPHIEMAGETIPGESLSYDYVKRMLEYSKKKYGSKWIRILGLTGALGGGMEAFEPSEAEASPVYNIMKAGAKVAAKAKLPLSRTATLLRNTEFMGGIVDRVTKGQGNWRYIIMKDGTAYPVTKEVVSSLVRHTGTVEKMEEFGVKQLLKQAGTVQGIPIDQALKSLAYHEARINPYLPRKTIRENYRDYRKQVRELGLGEAVPYSLVERGGRVFTMPSDYAELLEKEGHLKVIEGLK